MIRKLAGCFLLVSLLILGFITPIQQYFQLPSSITLMEGQELELEKGKAITVSAGSTDTFAYRDNDQAVAIKGEKQGNDELFLQIAGMPVKKIDVNVLKDFKVYPGGQSIGVRLNTLGVLVVGHHLVNAKDSKQSPGEKAGIETGDIITKINGEPITKMEQVAPFVREAGAKKEKLEFTIKREKEEFTTELIPLQDDKDKEYKLGIYIRDSAAGIGTMTFYDPRSKKYGALGHVISDVDTKKPIVVKDGQIVNSTVTSIEKGKNGNPGEKLARFAGDHDVIGTITRNSPFGVFGKLDKDIENGILDKKMPIALSSQVKEGPAKILTVVDGDKVEPYDIEIVSSIPQKFPATKGMVIKVTDKRLLSKTGGIVQGMSGSPIIQNDKVVGAVTHVFVNDPTSGYGVHIEWMLHEAGIDIYEKGELNQAS